MGRLRGLSTSAAVHRTDVLVDQLALAGGVDTALRRLSKGNLQKVGLAQALLVPPELLVLDEPWSGLDASAHGVLASTMATVAADGGTVVFTDHRESVVRTNATRVYRITGGRISPVDIDRSAPVPVTTMVLRSPEDGGLDLFSGALSVRRDGSRVVVAVAADDADRVLLEALRRGWSVVRVDEPDLSR
jgi:ABC-type uncharacterized transport system ATPase subunit